MLILLDRDESFISSLKYNDIKRNREINGANTLEFETNKEVEFGQRLLFKDRQGIWHEYIIIDYFKTHDDNGVTYEVYCEDSTSELYSFFIEDMKPRDATASNVLGRILEGTRFEVGSVDDFGKQSFNLYRTNCKAALWKVLERYQAEIRIRTVVGKKSVEHRYVDLKHSIGRDAGKRFTYKKDIGSIKKNTSTKELATALYGFGKGEEVVGDDGQPSGGYGRKIDFAEINGGKKYVEDNEARKKYGIGPDRMHIFGIADFDDCEDKKELLELTKAKLKEVSKPKITYELNVEDISRYEGYEGEGVDLGDIVLVKDEMIDTLVQTRVIAIKDNPIEEVNDSEIVLGNFIKDLSDNMLAYDKLKSTFENSRNKFNDELDKLANGVKTSYMQSVIDRFNKELNETGGFVYAEEGEGLLILNAPKEGNPTQAINLKGGKLAIANHKNADGSFAYETFGDGDGFTANLIRAGILRGGKVFFNLEDGTFLIGESRTKYSMYWDGTTLHLRDVDIDLSNNYQIKDINEELGSVKLEIKQTENSIQSSVASQIKTINNEINNKDSDIRSYISNNYSTKTQTSNLIDSRVSSVSRDLSGLGSRISTAESSIRQTSSEISSKVSKNGVISAINQSAESVKIQANKINLQGDVSLQGNFVSTSGGTISQLKDGELRFKKEYGNTLGSSIGLSEIPDTGEYMTRWTHDYESALVIGSQSKGIEIDGESYLTETDPYILFDRNNNVQTLHPDYRFGGIFVNEDVRFQDFATFLKETAFEGGIWSNSAIRLPKSSLVIGDWRIREDSTGDLEFFNKESIRLIRFEKNGDSIIEKI